MFCSIPPFLSTTETSGVLPLNRCTFAFVPDPIPQFLCTTETSRGPSSKSVQPHPATVEVDIMKKPSTKKPDDLVKLDSLQPNTVQDPAGCSDELGCSADKNMVGMEQERCVLETAGDVENKTDICLKQNETGPECGKYDTDKNAPSKTESVEQGILGIQQKVQAGCLSPLLGSSTYENCYSAEQVENGQSTYTMTQNNSSKRVDDDEDDDNDDDDDDDDDYDDDDDSNNDVGEGFPCYKAEVIVNGTSDVKIERKQVSPPNTAEKAHPSLAGGIMDADFFNKLQGLNFESCPEIETLGAGCKLHLVPAGDYESHGSQMKHAGDNRLPPLSVVGERFSKSLSINERLKDMNLEPEVSPEELNDEYDIMRDSQFKTEADGNSHLPSVEEFERYFEKYLKNGSSFEKHNVHSSDSMTSGVDSDSQDDDGTQSISDHEGQGCSIDPIPAELFHSVHWNYKTQSKNISPHELPKSRNNSGLCIGLNGCQTSTEISNKVPQCIDALQSSYGENTENSTFENYPSGAICGDKSCECQLRQCWPDHFSTTDYNWHKTSSNEWLYNGTRQLPPSSEQYFHQPYDQDGQWNLSWCNAYHTQVDYIKQFVSLSRGCALGQVKETTHWA